MLYQKWWKILGIVLLLYSLLAGLLVPLRPGIHHVENRQANAGEELELKLFGYNTSWSSSLSNEDFKIWLKYNDDQALKASKIVVENSTEAKATFEIPSYVPAPGDIALLSLVIYHSADGASVLPDAVTIRKSPNQTEVDKNAWSENPIRFTPFRIEMAYPYRNLLEETIRNQYFHVPLWFAMIILFTFSVVKSIQNLKNPLRWRNNHIVALNTVGVLLGILGLLTGMVWAKYTWGKAWSWDVKQTMALIAVCIYLAYFILRGSLLPDRQLASRVSNVYNIFAYVMLIPLLFIIPRMQDSLHPGAGGNPAFGGDDLDNTMRMVFYPSVIGFILLGMWIASLYARYLMLKENWMLNFKEYEK